MTFIGLLGIFISLCGFHFAGATQSLGRATLFMALLFTHIAAAILYQSYVQAFGGDALLYFDDTYGWFGYVGFGLSTVFVLNMVQMLKVWFGGSLLDYFLLFQAAGFWGILFLLRTFDDIWAELALSKRSYIYLVLFLPSLHFWTCAIGKDPLLFLASAMCVWGMLKFKQRYVAVVAALAIMVLVRAHIALIAVLVIGLLMLMDRRKSALARVALLGATTAAAAFLVVGAVEQTTAVDLSDPDSVTEFFARNSALDETAGADAGLTDASLATRIGSLLFRPLFLDAEGMLGYIASAENVVLIVLLVVVAWNWRTVYGLFRRVPFAAYCVMFTAALVLFLALISYNVGLGLRQRTMALPTLLALVVTIVAVKRARRSPPGFDDPTRHRSIVTARPAADIAR